MTFRMIAFKMFRANIRQYRLFIVCNLVSVAVLYSFISIAVNKQFKDPTVVNPMISSNIFAPTMLVVLFTCLFIPFTQNVFRKMRSHDYGILLTLGMTEREMRKYVLLENIALCLLFLLSGLGAGTLLSFLFWGVIHYGIGIQGLPLSISFAAYQMTAIYVVGIYALFFLVNLLGSVRSTILERIKFTERAESGRSSRLWLSAAGLGLTAVSFGLMIWFYAGHDNVWLLSLLLCAADSLLILFNAEAWINNYKQKRPQSYIKHLFLFSDITYNYHKNRMTLFVTTWIFFGILFFVMFSFVTYPSLKHNAFVYHPYHMAFAEVKGSFHPLGDHEVQRITEEHDNSILQTDRVEFLRNNVYTVFNVEDINTLLAKNYSIQPGSFIHVYPYDPNDGYDRPLGPGPSVLQMDSSAGARTFALQDNVMDPLFGQVNTISGDILVVRPEDFDWIAAYGKDYKIQGTLHLYNFADWRHSEGIVNVISARLAERNGVQTENGFYHVSSRIEAYRTAQQSSDFLMFTILYVGLLLYFSAITMVHFKLKMESREDAKKYRALFRIGLLEKEMQTMVRQKIRVMFSIPVGYAGLMALAYSYFLHHTYGYGTISIGFALLTVLAFGALHFFVYRCYVPVCCKQCMADQTVLR
ncbi:FtsX-like permease family protein [Paenibacillus sp. CN-4]|uniref:FtsX-like permease family protein n=1 Tax=Paenibacillus nanchangensis TaxID=3348343 RepID=UPI00397B1E64